MCIWEILTPTWSKIIGLVIATSLWLLIDWLLKEYIGDLAADIFFWTYEIITISFFAFLFYTGIILWC
jgi:hypothetical protein